MQRKSQGQIFLTVNIPEGVELTSQIENPYQTKDEVGKIAKKGLISETRIDDALCSPYFIK